MEAISPDAQGLASAVKAEPFIPSLSMQHECVRYLLRCIGEDPDREGLRDTPRRWCKALAEMTSGLASNPADLLLTSFAETCDEMILVRNIRFTSLCEHHLLPFSGSMTVGYLAKDKVIGLSKIPRIVEMFARRPSMQERLTHQVTNALQMATDARGVAAITRAHHSCMGCRGVRQADADMVTCSMLGVMREQAVRAEFLSLAAMKEKA